MQHIATMTPSDTLSPQERLAASRKAIVRHMNRDHKKEPHPPVDAYELDADGYDPYGGFGADESGDSRLSGTLSIVKHALKAWWHHHPVNVAYEFAQPVIGRFAANQPFKLLGIAAAVGAASVVIRPWRLVSLGGVALAAIKSSEFSGLALSMLSGSRSESNNTKTTR